MKSFYLNKAAVAAATALAAVAPAFAQSSVTLFGIVDDSIVYQSSQTSLGSTSGGRSNVKMASGIWAGSRFGYRPPLLAPSFNLMATTIASTYAHWIRS